ncbi:MAG TPA: hypothetical protein ENI51_03030 [Candidatus Atribacteria bacterium]|nr:hypothetical protein [Candidatus Atribacteria bacterium]
MEKKKGLGLFKSFVITILLFLFMFLSEDFYDDIVTYFKQFSSKELLAFIASLFAMTFLMFEIYRVLAMDKTKKLILREGSIPDFLELVFFLAFLFSTLAFTLFSSLIVSFVLESSGKYAHTLALILAIIFSLTLALLIFFCAVGLLKFLKKVFSEFKEIFNEIKMALKKFLKGIG